VVDFAPSVALPFSGRSWLARGLVGALLELLPALIATPIALAVARDRLHLDPFAMALLAPAVVLGLACRFTALGYLRRVAASALDGTLEELPPWDRFGTDMTEGFKLWLLTLGLFVPALGLCAAAALLALAINGSSSAWLLILMLAPPLALLTAFYLPAALLAAIDRDDVGAAFDLSVNWRLIGSGLGAYLLAFLVALVAEIVAQLGLLLCCVGLLLTRFMAHCVAVHAFASVYRASRSPRLEPASPESLIA
jgi:hypothetical protein